jgi:hypothetical protein
LAGADPLAGLAHLALLLLQQAARLLRHLGILAGLAEGLGGRFHPLRSGLGGRLAAARLLHLAGEPALVDLLDHEAVLVLAHAVRGERPRHGEAQVLAHPCELGDRGQARCLLLLEPPEQREVLLIGGVDVAAHRQEDLEAVLADDAVGGSLEVVGVRPPLQALELLLLLAQVCDRGLHLAFGPPAHADDYSTGSRGDRQEGDAAPEGNLGAGCHGGVSYTFAGPGRRQRGR